MNCHGLAAQLSTGPSLSFKLLTLRANSGLTFNYLLFFFFFSSFFRWEDAVPDFEAALQLDSNLASAHVNIGLIYIIKNSNYHK